MRSNDDPNPMVPLAPILGFFTTAGDGYIADFDWILEKRKEGIMAHQARGLEIPDAEDIDKRKSGDFLFLWCCDCGLRHIYHFEIIRGKTPEKDEVHIRSCRDDWATKARKKIAMLMKPKKRKTAKPKKRPKRKKK